MRYRLTRLHFPDPPSFGRAALFRFDAPDRSFGVCYLGTSLDCCLLEVMTPTYRATDLVDALAKDITPSAAIACLVTHLDAGSAVATIRGQQQMVRSTTLRVSCTRMRLSARC